MHKKSVPKSLPLLVAMTLLVAALIISYILINTLQLSPKAVIAADFDISRSTCVAPCAVFFDTTPYFTDDEFHNLHYSWDFGDPSSGNWAAGRKNHDGSYPSRNTDTGPMAAHVFDNPGTYTVTLTVRDAQNSGTTAKTIEITNSPSGGWTTYYVSASGNDANNGLSESSPFQTISKAFSMSGTNKKILLKRGDSFTLSGTAQVNNLLLGAYGHGNRPFIQTVGTNTPFKINTGPTVIMDIDLRDGAPSSGSESGIDLGVTGVHHVLIYRTNIQGFNEGVGNFFYYTNNQDPSTLLSLEGNIFIVDSTIQSQSNKGIMLGGDRIAILGTKISDTGSHAIRSWLPNRTIVAHSESTPRYLTPAQGGSGSAMKLHSATELQRNIREATYTYVHDNVFTVAAGFGSTIGSQNGDWPEYMKDSLIERNIFRLNPSTSWSQMFKITSKRVTFRNNIGDLTGKTGELVNLFRWNPGNEVQDIWIYNNLAFSGQSSMPLGNNEGITINVNYMNNVPSGISNLGLSNPQAGDYRVSSNSPLIDAGTQVPVFDDFYGNPRPSNNMWDIGAYELQQNIDCTVSGCPAGDSCTSYTCDPTTKQCISQTTSCDNGIFCDGIESCDPTKGCVPGIAPQDDGYFCTIDSCDESTDSVVHEAENSLCISPEICDPSNPAADFITGCVYPSGDLIMWLTGDNFNQDNRLIIDDSDNGNSGNCGVGTCPSIAPGKLGNALIFDGVNDHVVLSDMLTENLENITFTAWVRFDGGGAWQRIIDFSNIQNPSSSNGKYLFLSPNSLNGKIRYSITQAGYQNDRWAESQTSLSIGEWVHVALVVRDKQPSIYINGVLNQGATGGNGQYIYPNTLGAVYNYLGKSSYPADPYFHGAMDDIRIYKSALSAPEILALFTAQQTPECTSSIDCTDNDVCNGVEQCVNGACQPGIPLQCDNGLFCDGVESCSPASGCQPGTPLICDDQVSCTQDYCDESTDQCVSDDSQCEIMPVLQLPMENSFEDDSPAGNDPTCGLACPTFVPQGLRDGSYQFSGQQSLQIPDSQLNGDFPSASTNPAQSFTLAARIKLTVDIINHREPIISKMGTAAPGETRGFGFWKDADDKLTLELWPASGSKTIKSLDTLNVNQVYHVAAIYDAQTDTARVYIDGEPASAPIPVGGIPRSNSQPLMIGRYAHNTYVMNLDGILDDVEIYSSALTEDEIAELAFPPVCIDNDFDGYGVGDLRACFNKVVEDCDDNSNTVHPDAPEICTDNRDNNCNFLTDCEESSCSQSQNCRVRFVPKIRESLTQTLRRIFGF